MQVQKHHSKARPNRWNASLTSKMPAQKAKKLSAAPRGRTYTAWMNDQTHKHIARKA